jgi:hypothetical protein
MICFFVFIPVLESSFGRLFAASRKHTFPVARGSAVTDNSENSLRNGQQELDVFATIGGVREMPAAD